VGGEYVDPQTDATLDIVNPATAQVVAQAPVSTAADVDAAYSAASAAFEEWGRTTPSERQQALLKFADAVEARADDFVRLESENTGKPHALTASEEIPPMVDQIRFFAGAARVLEGRAAGEYMKGHTSWIRREPIGVVGQVTPWNYPMMMAVWKIAPALAAGNTVVLKPSDTTPETTLLLAEIASEWIKDGTAARLVEQKRAEAGARQSIAARALGGFEFDAHPLSFHLWLRLPDPWRGNEFSAHLRRRRVAVTPSEAFVPGRGEAPHAVRVCLGAPRCRAQAAGPLARSRPCRRAGASGACPRSLPWRPAPRRWRHKRWRSCVRPAPGAARRIGGSA